MKLRNFLTIIVVALALSGYSTWLLSAPRPETTEVQPLREVPGVHIPLIRLGEAEALWQRPTSLFLDVRSPGDYDFGHIAGAINLPEEEFEQRFPALKARLKEARAIVVYCKSRDCAKSLWTAIRLRNEGLTQTWIYPEGWNEWSLERKPTAGSAQSQ
jgi:rhodanese-related sulfurtransferase